MSDRLSALPDDILCSMLSLLTICDSVRTRLLSARWRYLLDDRSVLNIDYQNVFYPSRESDVKLKLVTVFDRVLELRKGRNHSALILENFERDLQASDVDRWVESGIKMKIETLELYLVPREEDLYVVPDKLFQCFHSRKTFYLKRLLLFYCTLTLSSECSSWISQLTTLELAYVHVQQKDIEYVVSGALNLTSLGLSHCGETDYLPIIVHLPRLKDLRAYKSTCFKQVELICPNLESFICVNQETMDLKFSYVPLLKKVDLVNTFLSSNSSLMFDELARHTPKLNELSFHVLTEISMCNNRQNGVRVQQREYLDNQHLHLKDVTIGGFKRTRNEMEFARYLLKNAVALERMILRDECYCSSTGEVMGTNSFCTLGTALSYATICRLPGREEMVTTYCSLKREEMAKTILKDLETNAKLVFKRGYSDDVELIASNRVGYGVQLFSPDPKEDEK